MAETDIKSKSQETPATLESDRHFLGQRRVNLIWEMTQAVIALSVSLGTLYVSAALALNGSGEMSAFLLLSNAFFLVIGFYFGRTNHQRVGGVGGGMNPEGR